MENKKVGTVKWFNNEKGYGFIKDNEANEIFVHYSEIQSTGFKTLAEGQNVAFSVVDTSKGKQAHEVVVISKK